MKKILHLTQCLSGGGAGRELIYLARYSMDAKEFHHKIVTLCPSTPDGLKLAEDYDVSVIEKPPRELLENEIENADITQVSWWNNPEITEFLHSYIPDTRLIIRYHVAGHNPPQCIVKEHLDMADVNVISYSELPILSQYEESWKKERIDWILHGTDFKRLGETTRKLHQTFNVGYIGTVSTVKMHPEYVKMSNEINVPNIKFVICGNIEENSLLRQVHKIGAEYKFDFKGYVDNIGEIISEMDVFGYPLCPDTYASTDLVLQEVMYAGVPAVVFNYGGLAQTVKDGHNGIVVNTQKEYKEAIEYLYNNPADRERLGENAKLYVEKNLGIHNTIKKYHSVYQRLLKKGKTWHEWGKDSHKLLLEQSLTFQDITGETPTRKTADIFIASMGKHGVCFEKSMNTNLSDSELFAADEAIADMSDIIYRLGILWYRGFDPKDAYLNFWAGLILKCRQNTMQAIEHWAIAHENGFNHWRLSWYMALALKECSNETEAAKVFQYLSSIKPDWEKIIKQSDSTNDIPVLSKIDEPSPETIYQDIKSSFKSGSSKEIIEKLEALLASYPDYALAHNDLGVLSYNQEDKDKAFYHYQQAAQLDPENITFQKNLADFYYIELGQVEKALQIYVKVLNKSPEDIETLFTLGHICIELEKFDDAKIFCNRILGIEPDNIEAKKILEKLEKYQLSLETGQLDQTNIKIDSERYLVSAILSTYNSEKYLRGCLESLIAQTISDQLEIIVVDSGSEQNEGAIVKEFQKKYSNIKYIKTENRETVYQAWNRGIKASAGKYITNANTDDRLHPDALNRLAQALETRNDVDIVYANSLITQTKNATWVNPQATRIFEWPDFNYRLLFDVCFLGPNPMWRRSLHARYGYFDERYKSAGDYEFWLRIAKHGVRMLHLREALSLYLENPTSISLSEPSISWEESEQARNSHWPPEWGKRPLTRWQPFEKDYKHVDQPVTHSEVPTKKILIACDYFWPSVGGVELYVADLGDKLQEKGYKVEIATRWLPERKLTEHRGLKIHQFKCDENLNAPLTIQEINKFRSLILKGGFEKAIVLTQPDNWVGTSIVDLPKPHSNIILLPSINKENLMEWEQTNKIPIIAKVLHAADHLVAVTETGYDAKSFEAAELNYHYIPHAVEQSATTDDFYIAHGFDADRPLLVMVANFWPVKNHIAILEHLVRVYGNWQFAMIGHPVSHFKEYYNRVVAQARKDPRVRLISGLPPEQAAAAIRDADLLLVPSKGESAGPLVVLQAMSYGTSWIATPECNAVHKESGGVVAELSKFSSVMNYLLSHENERNELGRLGQEHWLLSFTWEKTISSFINLIEDKPVSSGVEKTAEVLSINKLIQNQVMAEKIDDVGKQIKLSVIIPTYNRSAHLKKCLDALSDQTLPAKEFEVVICDDGSTDDTAEVVKRYRAPYELQYIHQSNRGAGAARNLGIKRAQGQVILFINDDVYPDENTLEQHLKGHKASGNMKVVILGHIDFASKYSNLILSRAYAEHNLLFPFVGSKENKPYDFDYFVTGNLSISRDAFYSENEWFDEKFLNYGCEDIELGYRLWKRGYWVYYQPSANAIHDHYMAVQSYLRREESNSKNLVQFLAKHPELNSRYLGVAQLTEPIVNQWREIVELQSLQVSGLIDEIGRINETAHSQIKAPTTVDLNTRDLVNKVGGALRQISAFLKKKTILQVFDENPVLRNILVRSTHPYPKTKNSQNPVISVVIPCFNYGQYLEEAVESIIGQTYQKFEIIIINDGSTDNTKEVAESLIAKYPNCPIRLINQKNSGQPAISRNCGISEANGEYILCLDADDMLQSTMLEKCLNVVEQDTNIAIAYTDRLDFDGANQVVQAKNYNFSQLKYANHISYCALFRREVWDKIGGYRTNIKGCEDWDFFVAAGARGYFGRRIPEPLFKYRRHDTGVFQQVLEDYDTKFAQIILNNQEIYNDSDLNRAVNHLGKKAKIQSEAIPLVSVIVPTLNRPKMLKETLKSILNQTYQNFEIVVINDGGEDVSEILNKFNDKRISYIKHTTNKGRSDSKNTGIKSAKGKYIAYLDDDDIYYQDHLETLVNELENGEFKVAYADSIEVLQQKRNSSYECFQRRLVYSQDFDRELLLKTNYIPILNVMHHRDCIEEIGFFDENLTVLEDWDFWIRMSKRFNFVHIPKVTAEYRVRSDFSNATTAESKDFPACRSQIWAKHASSNHRNTAIETTLLTSIIILTCNQLEYTKKCIDSIFKHTQEPFELILVDNGSTDETVKYLESEVAVRNRAVKVKIIKNKKNKGFAAGNNQGIDTAKGDYILLMNNDVVVTPGWLGRMIACAEKNPKIGIVGPRSNYVSGPQLVEQVSYDINTLEGLTEFAEQFAGQHARQDQQILRVVGFCMLIKRAVIGAIGGMDDRYGLGNFEDDDFSLRATIAGFQSWIALDSFIHHFGNRTFIGEKIDYRNSLSKNWELFKEKWGLPIELPYGSPYTLSQMKHTAFDHRVHYYPLEKEGYSDMNFDYHPSEPADLYDRIQTQLKTMTTTEAIAEFEKLVANHPKFAIGYNDLGVLHYQAGNKEEALKNYEMAARLDPENVTFKKNLADFYFVEIKQVEAALRIYIELLEKNPEDIEILLITGHICVALHKFEDAKVFYLRVLELEPYNEDARQNLTKLEKTSPMTPEYHPAEERYQEIQPLLNNGDPHKAIASLEELLESYPDFALAHNDLGVIYYHMGNKETARQHYERAVELMPDNLNIQKNLADFYCIEMGRIEEALKIFVNILQTDPQDIETLMATGQICAALEKPDDARDFFNRVLSIEPWNADAHQRLEELERPQSSVTFVNPESPDEIYRRLKQEMSTLSQAAAIDEFEKLLGSYPDFALGHNELGVLYYHTGDKEKSLQHYQRAAQLQPENITLQKNLADFLFVELRKIEEALQIYVNILAVNPHDAETLLITGHICVALKKFDDAKAFYQRVLELEPGNEDASNNLRALGKHPAGNGLLPADSENTLSGLADTVESNDFESDRSAAELMAKTVSIILSLDGIQNRVKECIKGIQAHAFGPHEVLLINRGATKGVLKWAQQLVKDNDDYHIIECARQAGRTEAINQAIQKASGEMIVLMHNDVVLPEGGLKAFKMCIDLEPNSGVVGPMSNRTAGIQQMIHSDGSDRVEFESAAKAFYEQNRYRRVAARKLSDFCLAFRRELPGKIGYFDEQFVSEAVVVEDFCNRAAAGGYQNLVAADTYVFHYDRHNVKKDAATKNSAGAEDRKKYIEKWNGTQNPEAKAFQTVQFLARADELSQKGQMDAAVETVLGGIGFQPEDERLYIALSEILLAAKRFQDAKDALTEMPSAGDHQEMRKAELLGYAEEGLQNFEAARAQIEPVLAMNPDRAPALNLKGILAYQNADRHSAEKYFKRAISADPGYGEPYTNLGMMQLEADQPEAALKSFENGFRLAPTDLDIATNYHTLIAGIAEYEKAENVARDAAFLYPNNQKIKYMLIDFLVQQGKFEEAQTEIEEAMIKFGIDNGILAAALKVREKLGPIRIQKSSKKAPVSLCVIIKDEEKYIARCLASVKPIVDEMIVIDTGSTDRSKDIAVTFGAQVYDYEWKNDFAAARNYSIQKASGEWILILDGDEVISPLDHENFKKIVKKTPRAPIAYSITTRNYNQLANIVGWVPNDGTYPDEEAAIGWLPSDKVRLFYGKDQIRFEGAVHELVDPVLKRNGIEIKKCSIPVHHYGRLDKEKLDRKGEIYFEIGQKKLAEMGDDVNALRELAIQATILERNQEALDLWQRLLAINPFPKLAAIAYVNMGTVYSRLGRFEDALDVGEKAVECDPDLKEARYNYAMAELHAGNAQQTIRILEDLLSEFPDYPPARFILSAAHCCADQKEKGLEGIRNLKNTPLGAHLAIPCLELGQSLISAKQIRYALWVLGAMIESDIANPELLALFKACLEMKEATQKCSHIPQVPRANFQGAKFENLPQ